MPMSPTIPADVIEEIIDNVHNLDDVKSLRNLVLTSHSFLRRSRYHLFSSHIHLDSIKKLNSFCDFLDAHPDRRPWVRSVTICSTKESPSLLEVVPVRLLADLPSLKKWRIFAPFRAFSGSDLKQRRCISSNTPRLRCLQHYAQLITHLHLESARFQSCADFARYILAFPGLRHLQCEHLEFQHEDHVTALVRAREHLSKGLQLSHLTMRGIPDVGVTLLLESVHHTLQELVIDVTSCIVKLNDVTGDFQLELYTDLPTLIPRLSKLSSITLQAMFVESQVESTDDAIRHVVEILQALASNPNSLITQITVHSRDCYVSKLLGYMRDHSDDLGQTCRTLETSLLGLPRLQKIELYHHLRRPIRSWTPTRLEQFFPILQKRGLINMRCLAPPIQSHSFGVNVLAMSPDGGWIASCSSDTTIILWDAQRGTIVQEWPAHLEVVTSLAFSPDGRHLASGGYDRKVMVWGVGNGTESDTVLVTTLDPADVFVWSPDGAIHALAWDSGGAVQVWNPSTNQVQLHTLERYSEKVWGTMIFSPDGHWTVVSDDDSWKVWDATTGRLQTILPGTSGGSTPYSIAFDPTSQRLAIPFDNDSIRIWDVETGDQLVVLQSDGTRGIIHNITFSPNGTRVLSMGSDDTMVRLWDAFSGDILLSFREHEGEVNAACFSPDEKYVASASYDHTVRLWSASTGLCIRTFTEHDYAVGCVEFSRDGETLISGGLDGRMYMRRLRDVCPEEYSGNA